MRLRSSALWVASGSYVVPTGQQGVVTTFGAYSRMDGVGQNYHLPAPIEQVSLVSTGALQVMDVGAAGADDPKSLMLTSDGNIVSVNFTVQYRIADPRKYLFDLKDPSEAIRNVAGTAIREVVGKVAYAQVISGGHAAMQNETRARMQATLNRYGAGVSVVDVQIIAAAPPRDVGSANQAVVNARQAVQAALTDANAANVKAANDAKAAGAKARADAVAYSARVVSEAQAETARFAPLDAEYRLAPAITKQRIYNEAMERILSHARVVVDARGAAMPLIPAQEPYRPRGPTVEAMTPGAAK